MPHVFTYGSLMFDPVWSRVAAGDYDRCEAILPGYERKSVQDEVYPVIVPSGPHSQVKGILYTGVSASDLARLDRFEGEYYFRKTERVVTMDEIVLTADTYVLKEEYYMIISHRNWDPVRFMATDIHYFLSSYWDGEKQ